MRTNNNNIKETKRRPNTSTFRIYLNFLLSIIIILLLSFLQFTNVAHGQENAVFTGDQLSDFLNFIELPHLESVLAEKFNIDELFMLKHLKSMDYQDLYLEYEVPKEEAKIFEQKVKAQFGDKKKLEQIKKTNEKEAAELARRDSFTFGKLLVNGSLDSFEFHLAHFGKPIPLGEHEIVFADPLHACRKLKNNVTNKFVVATRGKCNFVDKAWNATMQNATAILIVNDDENIFRVSAGYALGKNPENVSLPENITTVLVKNRAYEALKRSASVAEREGVPLKGSMIPLECGKGNAACIPTYAKDVVTLKDSHIAAGYLHVMKNNTSIMKFEALTSMFGGRVPLRSLPLVKVESEKACVPLPSGLWGWFKYIKNQGIYDLWNNKPLAKKEGYKYKHSIAMVKRGNCTFGEKAFNMQFSEADLLLIVADENMTMQTFGISSDLQQKVIIPAIMVTHHTEFKLLEFLNDPDTDYLFKFEAGDVSLAEHWQDIATTQWPKSIDEVRPFVTKMQTQHPSKEQVEFIESHVPLLERQILELNSLKIEHETWLKNINETVKDWTKDHVANATKYLDETIKNETLKVVTYETPWVINDINGLRDAYLREMHKEILLEIEENDKQWKLEFDEFVNTSWPTWNQTVADEFSDLIYENESLGYLEDMKIPIRKFYVAEHAQKIKTKIDASNAEWIGNFSREHAREFNECNTTVGALEVLLNLTAFYSNENDTTRLLHINKTYNSSVAKIEFHDWKTNVLTPLIEAGPQSNVTENVTIIEAYFNSTVNPSTENTSLSYRLQKKHIQDSLIELQKQVQKFDEEWKLDFQEFAKNWTQENITRAEEFYTVNITSKYENVSTTKKEFIDNYYDQIKNNINVLEKRLELEELQKNLESLKQEILKKTETDTDTDTDKEKDDIKDEL